MNCAINIARRPTGETRDVYNRRKQRRSERKTKLRAHAAGTEVRPSAQDAHESPEQATGDLSQKRAGSEGVPPHAADVLSATWAQRVCILRRNEATMLIALTPLSGLCRGAHQREPWRDVCGMSVISMSDFGLADLQHLHCIHLHGH